MGMIVTEHAAHRATCASAEMTRQAAVAGASQSTIKAAEIAFFRTCRASAIANGLSPSVFTEALQELGTGGA